MGKTPEIVVESFQVIFFFIYSEIIFRFHDCFRCLLPVDHPFKIEESKPVLSTRDLSVSCRNSGNIYDNEFNCNLADALQRRW